VFTVYVEFTPRDQYTCIQRNVVLKKHVTSFRYKIWFYFFIYGIKSASKFFCFVFYYSFEDQFCWLRVIRYAYIQCALLAYLCLMEVYKSMHIKTILFRYKHLMTMTFDSCRVTLLINLIIIYFIRTSFAASLITQNQ